MNAVGQAGTMRMERVEFGSGVTLSRMIYGMWRLGDDADRSPARVQAKIEACLAQGITSFDQADIYGDYESETLLGAALRAAPSLRDRMEIVTKCDIVLRSDKAPARRVKHYDTSAAHIRASVDASLANMGTDRVDMLLIHRPDPLMDAAETGATLDAVVASGKARTVGVSNFRPLDIDLLQGAMQTRLVSNQIEISLIAHDPLVNGDLAYAQRHKMPPMAWSPLGGGALFAGASKPLRDLLHREAARAGTDIAAVAVAWLLRHPARILPVMGTNDLSRIESLSDATRVDLDRETWFELYEAALGTEVP